MGKIKNELYKIILIIALGIMAKFVYTIEFPIIQGVDISFNFVPLPSIIASIIFGPFWGAFFGGTIDLLGHFLHPIGSFLPQITIMAIVRGFLPGFLIQKFNWNKIKLKDLIFSIGITMLITQVIMMSLILYQEYDALFIETLIKRLFVLLFTVPTFAGVSYIFIKQKSLQEEIQKREQQFSTLVANIPDVIFRCKNDKNRTMIYMSDYIEKITSYPVSDFINNSIRTYKSIILDEDRLKVDNIISEHISRKKSYFLNYRILNARGKIRYIYEKGEGIFDKSGKLQYIDGVISDITENIKKEEQLLNIKKGLIVTRERNRIARELHDSVSQGLHGINYCTHTLRKMIKENNNNTSEVLDQLEITVKECLQELKNMISALKPTKLEEKGLSKSLIIQCDIFAERTNIKLSHDIDDIKRLTPEQELAIYRILQEALTNIQKHSGADQVRVLLKEIENRVFLTIADNGKGFEIENLEGNGLNNMKTRTFQNNGEFEIESPKGKGTVIRVSFNLM